MIRPLSLLALLFLAACRTDEAPASQPTGDAVSAAPSFVGKAWMGEGSGDLPGVLRIFLPDGTLVMDSCWETYRLAQWKQVSDRSLMIVEDGQEIPAEILDTPENELRLRLALVGGEKKDEVYRPAPVPYLCPDMPR